MLDLYAEAVAEVGPEAFYAAWLHVLKTSEFRPDIARIRKAAGLDDALPGEREAQAALTEVIQAIRKFGKKLEPKSGGRRERLDEATGRTEYYMAANETHEGFGRRIDAAIEFLGRGRRSAGLEEIACHPSLGYEGDPSFRMKAAREVESAWLAAWRAV
jgi:hypothetical protein